MKSQKLIVLFLVLITMIISMPCVMANEGISVVLDDKKIEFDVQPQIMNDRTMVPLRAIFEALGAEVYWDGETQTVTSIKEDTIINLTIGQSYLYKNKESEYLDSPPCIVNGRTLVPVRAISEAFGLKVDWVEETSTVLINSADCIYDDHNNIIYEKNEYGITTYNYVYYENGNIKEISSTYVSNEKGSKGHYTTNGISKYNKDNKVVLAYGFRFGGLPIPPSCDLIQYDSKGNEIYRCNYWWLSKAEFDSDGYIVSVNNNNTNVKIEKGIMEDNSEFFNIYWISSDDENKIFDKGRGINKYNEEGILISSELYNKDDKLEYKYEYDNKGNKISYQNSNGVIYYEYDENNRLIREYGDGKEGYTLQYDENDNIVYKKYDGGFWNKYEYEENNQLTCIERSDGYKKELKNGFVIYECYSPDDWYKYERDEKGNILSLEDENGITWFAYDDMNRIIRKEYDSGAWYRFEYDIKGNVIRRESNYDDMKDYIDKENKNIYWLDYKYDTNFNIIQIVDMYGNVYNDFIFSDEVENKVGLR